MSGFFFCQGHLYLLTGQSEGHKARPAIGQAAKAVPAVGQAGYFEGLIFAHIQIIPAGMESQARM
jgi:hypothetical protein